MLFNLIAGFMLIIMVAAVLYGQLLFALVMCVGGVAFCAAEIAVRNRS